MMAIGHTPDAAAAAVAMMPVGHAPAATVATGCGHHAPDMTGFIPPLESSRPQSLMRFNSGAAASDTCNQPNRLRGCNGRGTQVAIMVQRMRRRRSHCRRQDLRE